VLAPPGVSFIPTGYIRTLTDASHLDVLRQFLEDSFCDLDGPPIFDAELGDFLRPELECWSPKKLPKKSYLGTFEPRRLTDEAYKSLNDVSAFNSRSFPSSQFSTGQA
jgi:hypothetical protein